MAANVSWHCFHRGSENMALLAKTYIAVSRDLKMHSFLGCLAMPTVANVLTVIQATAWSELDV